MSGGVAGGLVLALGSTACLNWGFVRQHGEASAAPPLSIRRPLASLALLFRNLRWLTGFVVGLAGWALYIAALRLAPISLVQAVAAGGIGLLALFARRATGRGLSRREWTGVGLAAGGLLLLGLSLAGGSSSGSRASAAAVGVWLALSVVGAALFAGPLSSRLAGGAGLGVAAGMLYAAGDVATKAAVAGGAAVAFTVGVLALHGLGFVALQLGFQRGNALATAGVSTLAMNALPIAAGTVVFSESLPGGAAGAARVLAFAAVVAGAALLARPESPERKAEAAVEEEGANAGTWAGEARAV